MSRLRGDAVSATTDTDVSGRVVWGNPDSNRSSDSEQYQSPVVGTMTA